MLPLDKAAGGLPAKIPEMTNGTGLFYVKLLVLSFLLWLTHYYVVFQFFPTDLYYPIWTIYCFNTVLVLVVYTVLKYAYHHRPHYVLKLFLGLTMLKMIAAIVFLVPLFLNRSQHTKLEVFNFFIPYFLYLIFEIYALNRFLQKS